MGKLKKLNKDFSNPFLGPERDKLWERLKQNAKPVSKAELFEKAAKLRKQAGK